MKIAVISHTFPKSKNEETAAFLHALMLGFKKAKGEPVVMVPYAKELRQEDFPYMITSFKYIWPSFLHVLGYASTFKKDTRLPMRAYVLVPFLFIFGVLKLLNICKQEKIDIISAHWLLPNGLIAAAVSKITSIPYVVTSPGSDVYVGGMNALFRKLTIFVAENASCVIADSPLFIKKIGQLGASMKKTEVIPYPVDVTKYKSNHNGSVNLRRHLGIDEHDAVVLAVGRLVEKKGFRYLLECMGDIIDENKNVRLVIVGDGSLKEEFVRIVKQKKIEKHTAFAGSVGRDEILSYYNLADIFVMPSISDAQGNVDDQPVALLEAMSCSLPVVATNFPGIALSVKDKINGFLTPQKGVKEIKAALLKLISSKGLREKMGRESRKLAVANISLGKVGGRYMVLFKRILDNKRR